jgi:hypothetical protein
VLDRLVRVGTAVAHSDGSVHRLFPVSVGATEGAALRSWVISHNASTGPRTKPSDDGTPDVP